MDTPATKAAQRVSDTVDTHPKLSRPSPARVAVGALLTLGAFVPTALIAKQFTTSTDKVAYEPGGATSANRRIDVGEFERHPADGKILFVTITVPDLNELSLSMAKRDPTVDIYERTRIFGDQTRKEARNEDLQLMRDSRSFAAYVALKRLGYGVNIVGGGAVVRDMCLETTSGTCTKQAPAATLLQKNDVIVEVDGDQIQEAGQITAALRDRAPGDRVRVVARRGETQIAGDVELIVASEGTRAIIGFVPGSAPPATARFEIPKGVEVDSGDVGGPSAGLAFTLAIIEELTPGELTGGLKVAVTGEISLGGDVGEIGGLRQKTVAVLRENADAFLVPKSQMDEAVKQAAGTDLKVIGVSTLDEALTELAKLGGNANEVATKQP